MRTDLLELLRCPRSGGRFTLEALERDGDDVEAGVLRSDAGAFPIVAGIPVLRGGDEGIVDLLLSGDAATATALAIVRHTDLSRLDALVPLLLDLRPTRPVGRRLLAYRDRAVARRAAAALAAAAAGSPEPLLRLTYLEGRRPNPEGYRYFRYRLGLPRHLVALGAVAAARPGTGPVVEVGCGAGHLAGQFQSMLAPRRLIAVERDLDLLWIARRHLAPAVDHLCADATSLPLPTESCSLAVAVDVLSFVEAKATACRELRRVIEPGGGVVLSSLINATATHEFAGSPLPVQAWRRLVTAGAVLPADDTATDHLALADQTVLDAYLEGSAAPGRSDEAEVLDRARTITLLAGHAATAGAGLPLRGWPHAIGRLGTHPVLHRVPGEDGSMVRYRREYPSAGFVRDNPDLERYLPRKLTVGRGSIDEARAGGSPVALADAVASVAVLGYPEGWPEDPWST